MKLSTYKKMWRIANSLENTKNYDIEGFIDQLEYTVSQISFFHNVLVPKTGNVSKTFFDIKGGKPKEGQVAYFNLTRGFPKELYDVHYCYILKDFESKFLVLPLTSVKNTSGEPNPKFEFDITIKDFINDSLSRVHVDELRVLDAQRLIPDKGYYDVEDTREDILDKVKKIIFG